jgi:hypothetical protein
MGVMSTSNVPTKKTKMQEKGRWMEGTNRRKNKANKKQRKKKYIFI